MEDINKQISVSDKELLEKKNLLSELEQETKKFNIQKEEHLRELQQTEIQITTLSNFVDSEIEDEVTNQFLKKIDIDKDRNIFKNVNIEKGWEKAIGFILADYASAYENKKISPNSLEEIPTNIAIVFGGDSGDSYDTNTKLNSVLSKINSKNQSINNVLTRVVMSHLHNKY